MVIFGEKFVRFLKITTSVQTYAFLENTDFGIEVCTIVETHIDIEVCTILENVYFSNKCVRLLEIASSARKSADHESKLRHWLPHIDFIRGDAPDDKNAKSCAIFHPGDAEDHTKSHKGGLFPFVLGDRATRHTALFKPA